MAHKAREKFPVEEAGEQRAVMPDTRWISEHRELLMGSAALVDPTKFKRLINRHQKGSRLDRFLKKSEGAIVQG
jgi:hypothetical protein